MYGLRFWDMTCFCGIHRVQVQQSNERSVEQHQTLFVYFVGTMVLQHKQSGLRLFEGSTVGPARRRPARFPSAPPSHAVQNAQKLLQKRFCLRLDQYMKLENVFTTQGSPGREHLNPEEILCVRSLDGRGRGV